MWEKWPLKLEFKNQICEAPPEDYKGRAKSGAYCALSGEWTGKSAGEIDHLIGHVSLKDWEDVLPFIQHLCASKDNMQFVAKEAHKCKSYAERMGITYEEAVIQKEIIAIMNAKADRQWLESRDIVPASNAKLRRAQIEQEMKK